MLFDAYKRAFAVLKRKPIRLWGLSMLCSLVCVLAGILTAPLLIVVGLAFGLIVSTGMSKVYVDAVRGEEINSDQLFVGFSSGRVWRYLGAYAWRLLWIFIWSVGTGICVFLGAGVIAVIGYAFRNVTILSMIFYVLASIVSLVIGCFGSYFMINRTWAYSFVPYILVTKPELTATQALRLSVKMTNGKKLQMFLAKLLFSTCISIVLGILLALSLIPYVGFVFGIVFVVAAVLVLILAPLFEGLVAAYFFVCPDAPNADKPDLIGRMSAKLSDFEKKTAEETPAAETPAPEAPAPEAPAEPEGPAEA